MHLARRLICLFLALTLCLSLVPASALALETEPAQTVPTEETTGTDETVLSVPLEIPEELLQLQIDISGTDGDSVAELCVGDRVSVSALFFGAAVTEVQWRVMEALSDDVSSIAAVDESGTLEALEAGFCRLSAVWSDGEQSYTAVREISIAPPETQPTEEAAVPADTAPATEAAAEEPADAPTEQAKATEETLPAVETAPAVETVPTEETVPAGETVPTEETVPVEETAPSLSEAEADYVIDPAVSYPEAPADALRHIIFEDEEGFTARAVSNEFYNLMVDNTPHGEFSVNADTALAYQKLLDAAEAVPQETTDLPAEDASEETIPAEPVPDPESALKQLQKAMTARFGSFAASSSYPTPSNLRWGSSSETYGVIYFDLNRSVNLSNVYVDVTLYRNGSYYYGSSWSINGTVSGSMQLDYRHVIDDSGTFYFTVQLVSRNNGSDASGIGTSGTWKYTAPSARLGTPSNLRWKQNYYGTVASWNAVSNAGGYMVYWHSQYGSLGATWFYYPSTECGYSINEYAGETRFSVRALASNITAYRNGYESGQSGAYMITGGSTAVVAPITGTYGYINVISSANMKSVSGVTISVDGTAYTSENGQVRVPMSSGQTKTCKITCSDSAYCPVSYTMDLTAGKTTKLILVPLIKGSDQTVTALILNNTTDVMTTQVTKDHKDTSDWNFVAYSNLSPSKIAYFELLQDGLSIAKSNSSGIFNTLHCADFKGDQPVWVRAVLTDGKIQKSYKTSLSIIDEKPTAEVELGQNTRVKLPDNLPILGGAEFELDLEFVPVQVVFLDDTMRFGIGLEEETFQGWADTAKDKLSSYTPKQDLWDDFKKYVDKYFGDEGELVQGMDAFHDIKDGLSDKAFTQMGKWMPETKVSFFGYAEMKKVDGSWCQVGGTAILEISVKVENEWQAVVPVVSIPIVIGVEASVSAEDTLNLHYNSTQRKWGLVNELKLIIPSVKVSGGVGIAKVANVSVYGKLVHTFKWNTKNRYKSLNLKGEVGLSGKILMVSGEWPLGSANKTYWEHYGKGKASLDSSGLSMPMPDILDESSYSIDRSYLSYQSGWGRRSAGSTAHASEYSLQCSIYEDVQVQMVEAGDVRMMVFLADTGSRSNGNQVELMYSVATAGSWSAPRHVHDDGTADFYPSLATDGTDIYVAWQNSDRTFPADVTLEEAAAAGEIFLARYDATAGAFDTPEQITDNTLADTTPELVVADGEPIVVWHRNDSNDILTQTGTNHIYRWTGGIIEQVWSGNTPVTALAAGEAGTYYALDNDGDLSTLGFTLAGFGTENPVSLQTACIDGTESVFWGSSGTVYKDGSPIVSNVSGEFTVIPGSGGDYALLVTEFGDMEADSTQTGAILYNAETQSFTSVIALTDSDGYKHSFSGVMHPDGSITAVYASTLATISDGTMYTETSLNYCTLNSSCDLTLQQAALDQDAVASGAESELRMQVRNSGSRNIDSVTVSVQGSGVDFSETVALTLPAGAEGTFSVLVPMPEQISYDTLSVSVFPDADSDSCSADNHVTVDYGYAALAIGAELVSGVDSQGILIGVQNSGPYATSAAVNIRKFDAAGPILETVTIDLIEPYSTQQIYIDGTSVSSYGVSSVGCEVVASDPEYYTTDNRVLLPIDVWGDMDLARLPEITMSMSMVQLDLADNQSVRLSASIDGYENAELSWYTEDTGSGFAVAEVDSTGLVTALNEGSTYVVASTLIAGNIIEARCRVDVQSRRAEEAVTSVSVPVSKTTVNVFSTDYAEIDVLLNSALITGSHALTSGNASLENQGVTIRNAWFEDETVRSLFRLRVKDDRTLQVIPTVDPEDADAVAALTGSYASPIVVEIGTSGAARKTGTVTLSVQKILPKLTADSITLNSFMDGDTASLRFSDEVSRVIVVSAPQWLDTNAESRTVSLNSAVPDTGSGTLTLSVRPEGYTADVTVSVKLKVVSQSPKLKLSASKLTFADAAPSEHFQGTELSILSADKKVSYESLSIRSVSTDSTAYEVTHFDSETGLLRLRPTGIPADGTVTLNVGFEGTGKTVSLNLSVKTAKVALTASSGSVKLNTAFADKMLVALNCSPADYLLDPSGLEIAVADSKGNPCGAALTVRMNGKYLEITNNTATQPGMTYTVTVTDPASGAVCKIKAAAQKPSEVKIKQAVSDKINLVLGTPTALKVSYTGFNGYSAHDISFQINAYTGSTVLGDITDQFAITQTDSLSYLLAPAAGSSLPTDARYTIQTFLTINGVSYASSSATLKTTAELPKLKLGKSSVTLNSAMHDTARISLTSLMKGYVPGSPIITVTDKAGYSCDSLLQISYADGFLTVDTIPGITEFGATYFVHIQAMEGAPAVKLTVKTNAMSKSGLKLSLSAKGDIDPLRPDSTALVSMKLSNCNSYENLTFSCFFAAYEKKYPVTDCSESFQAVLEDGVFRVKMLSDAYINPQFSYRMKVNVYSGSTMMGSAEVDLRLKEGKASAQTDAASLNLYRDDCLSAQTFRIFLSDATLAGIERVELVNAEKSSFALTDLGNGYYRIGFREGTDSAKLKTQTVKLAVYLKGSLSDKPSCTLSLKVNVS